MLRTIAIAITFFVAVHASAQCVPPSVAVEPAGTTIAAGRSATLTTVVAGTEPLDYDWYETTGGPPQLRSETGASITVSPLQTTTYYAQISNACGNTTTAEAVVTVNGPPVIVTEPQARTSCINAGMYPTHTVTAAGPGPLTYSWYGRGPDGQFTLLQSGSSASYSDQILVSQGGSGFFGADYIYWVVVSNSYGSTVSNPFMVRTAPSPDHSPQAVPSQVRPGDYVMLTGNTFDSDSNCCSWNEQITETNLEPIGTGRRLFFQPANSMTVQAYAGDGNCFMMHLLKQPTSFTISPSAPPPAQCTQGAAITVEPADTGVGSGSGTSVQNYASASFTATGTWTPLFDWYKVGPNGESILLPPTSNTLRVWGGYGSGLYFAWAYNSCGAQITRAVTIRDCVAAPVIVTEPADVTIGLGQSASVFVQSVRGKQNIQWYRASPSGSQPLGTGRTLVVAPLQTETYFAWIYNDCGATITRVVTVTVKQLRAAQ